MKKKTIWLPLIIMSAMASLLSCDTGQDQETEKLSLTGKWKLVNIAGEVQANDMEKALVTADLVNTAFLKKGSVITFYAEGDFIITTHDGEQITARYTLTEEKLKRLFDTGEKVTLILWIAGNVMRTEEDCTTRYKYENTPYPTVEKVIKINHLIRQDETNS